MSRFFEQHGDSNIHVNYYGVENSFTVEELYEAFKDRMKKLEMEIDIIDLPEEPKEGEWWMCKLAKGRPQRPMLRTSTTSWTPVYTEDDDELRLFEDSYRGIEPLYRMVKG